MLVESRPLSTNGPHVSELVAGFWRLKHWDMSPQALLAYLQQLVELGVTTVDHAMVYGSEQPFGDALKLQPSLRSQLQIVTKCGIHPAGQGPLGVSEVNHYDCSPEAIEASVHGSLKALGTDYLDVLLLHRPDYLMDTAHVADVFAKLKAQGKVRYFGVSNFSVHQFAALQQACADGLVTNQIELSPLAMQALESGVLEQSVMHGFRPMLWSCLAGGQLLQPNDDRGRVVLEALRHVQQELAAESVDQVAFAWCLHLPCRPIPLLGTRNIERVKSAIGALSLQLNRDQWYRIWEASNGASVP